MGRSSQECLPAGTILAAPIIAPGPNGAEAVADLIELVHAHAIRIGGSKNTGKGMVWCHVLTSDEAKS